MSIFVHPTTPILSDTPTLSTTHVQLLQFEFLKPYRGATVTRTDASLLRHTKGGGFLGDCASRGMMRDVRTCLRCYWTNINADNESKSQLFASRCSRQKCNLSDLSRRSAPPTNTGYAPTIEQTNVDAQLSAPEYTFVPHRELPEGCYGIGSVSRFFPPDIATT